MPIEWNARLGGAECPESVEAVSGHWLPRVAAELALTRAGYHPAERAVGAQDTVVSANIHLTRSGRLTALHIDGDRDRLELASLSLFGNQVGSIYMPGRGSASCLGWLAAGGASKVEATARLRCALERIVVELDGERVPMHLVCDHIGLRR